MQITRDIPLGLILPPPEPVRKTMDEDKLEDLARSIAVEGLINAITVEPVEHVDFSLEMARDGGGLDFYIAQEGKFEVIAGHRRLLASLHINAKTIRCDVHPKGSTNKISRMLHENAYREDMSASEEGWAYCELADTNQWTVAQICQATRQTPSYVQARIDLVTGDAEIALAVHRGDIKMSIGRELNKCTAEDYRRYLLSRAIAEGSSALQARTWVLNWKVQEGIIPPLPAPAAAAAPTPETQYAKPACALCGGDADPYNLETVYVHRHELELIKQIQAQRLEGDPRALVEDAAPETPAEQTP